MPPLATDTFIVFSRIGMLPLSASAGVGYLFFDHRCLDCGRTHAVYAGSESARIS